MRPSSAAASRPLLCLLIPVLLAAFVRSADGADGEQSGPVIDCRPLLDDGVLSRERRPWRGTRTSPPRFSELSASERVHFTRCGTIPVDESMFVDDSGPPGGTFYQFSADHARALVDAATALVALVREHGASRGALLHARRRRQRAPPESEVWLLEALVTFFSDEPDELDEPGERLPSGKEKKSVLVFGSMSPWVEALCLAFGATETTTVEYNRLNYDHSAMSTVTADDFWAAVDAEGNHDAGNDGAGKSDGDAAGVAPAIPCAPFAAILSISSFDHDGLGRYGDPIAPDGDILTMRRILAASDRLLASPDDASRMFLTVPLGPDLVAWNLMRRYGRVRLPLLLGGWDVVQTYGFEDARLDLPNAGKRNFRQSWEPVLVLAKGYLGTGGTGGGGGPRAPKIFGEADTDGERRRAAAVRDAL